MNLRLLTLLLLPHCLGAAGTIVGGSGVTFVGGSGVTLVSGAVVAGPADPTLLWWKMNEGTGTALNDDSVANEDGTTDGTWSDGGIQLNGTSQEIASNSSVTYGVQVITVSLWLQVVDWSAGGTQMVVNNNFGSNGSFYVYLQFGNVICNLYDSGTNREETFDVSALSTGTWYHFAFVFDNSTNAGDIKLYINADPKTTGLTNGKSASGNIFAGSLEVGGQTGSLWLAGKFDDLRIYSSEVSAGDITTIYGVGRQ